MGALNKRFLHSSITRARELKRMLTTVHKFESQSMDAYLRDIKTIVNKLAVVNSPVPRYDLVHCTLFGLG